MITKQVIQVILIIVCTNVHMYGRETKVSRGNPPIGLGNHWTCAGYGISFVAVRGECMI